MLSSTILLPSQSVVFLALPIPCDASVTCMMSIAMAWVCTPSTLFTSQCTTSALMKQYGERPFCSESSWIPVLNHSKWHMWEHGLTDSSFWLQTQQSLLGKKKKKRRDKDTGQKKPQWPQSDISLTSDNKMKSWCWQHFSVLLRIFALIRLWDSNNRSLCKNTRISVSIKFLVGEIGTE